MVTTNRFAFSPLLLALTACAPGFQAQNPQADLSSESAAVHERVSTSEGELSWVAPSGASSDATDLRYDFELKVPFGKVYSAASLVTRTLAPYACQPVEGISNSSPSDYKAGEIPCGQILTGEWKQLMAIPILPFQISAGGFLISVDPLIVPILVSRNTHQGNYSEDSLDEKGSVQRLSSANFGDDISVRYTPDGTRAKLEMCLNIPGVDITSPAQNVRVTASKYVVFGRVYDTSTFTVTPGQASFDYGRGCFAVDFGWTGDQLTPSIHFSATQAPRLSNVNYAGLQVKINNWLLALTDSILKFFNVNIRQNLISRLTRTVNDYADSDIETGRWFGKVHGEALLNRAGEDINKRISSVVRRLGIPATSDDLRAQLHDSCRLLKLSGSSLWNERFNAFCTDVVDNVQIIVQPFAVDDASKASGCYDHFARIHETKDASGQAKWWAKDCKFAAHFSVVIPAKFKNYDSELKQVLGQLLSPERIPTEWLALLKNQQIDAYLLSLALEELEKRGYTKLTLADLEKELPQIIGEIRSDVSNAI